MTPAQSIVKMWKDYHLSVGRQTNRSIGFSRFLHVNGLMVVAKEDKFEKLVLDAAQNIVDKERIANFFRITKPNP